VDHRSASGLAQENSVMLKAGSPAPHFELLDTNGRLVRLSDYLGKKVVLYFYPKDDTPGCTKEACNFKSHYKTFEKANVVVFGISPDDQKSHQKFTEKYNLSFPLLSDIGHKVADQFGVWGKKKMYGKEYDGILRSTFIIDEHGKIFHVFDKVKVDTHAEDVLAVLK
jgi:peroxiredoxin Q/BCP